VREGERKRGRGGRGERERKREVPVSRVTALRERGGVGG